MLCGSAKDMAVLMHLFFVKYIVLRKLNENYLLIKLKQQQQNQTVGLVKW